MAKVPEVSTHDVFLTQGVEIGLIFALWAVASEILADFKIGIFVCHLNKQGGKAPGLLVYFFQSTARS